VAEEEGRQETMRKKIISINGVRYDVTNALPKSGKIKVGTGNLYHAHLDGPSIEPIDVYLWRDGGVIAKLTGYICPHNDPRSWGDLQIDLPVFEGEIEGPAPHTQYYLARQN
jgi:hypothetical protein